MIKSVIFDLDGVLIDTRDIHYDALNQALGEVGSRYVIEREEHLAQYDGLPTRQKLEKLSIEKGLPECSRSSVWERKQDLTLELIRSRTRPDEKLIEILRRLREQGYRIYVASNAVRETVKLILLRQGLMEHVDHFFSNEDVRNPKPNPEIYLRCMLHAGLGPRECLIVEDSRVGRQAAYASGAHLCAVRSPADVTGKRIWQSLSGSIARNEASAPGARWEDPDLNILIPMAGAGARYEKAGYTFPKPLIEIATKPMIQVVVENLCIDAHYIFIVQRGHYERYNLHYLLNLIAPGCEILQIEGLTQGAACTTLVAEKLIESADPLLIVNSDQFVEWDSAQFMYSMSADAIDGGIATFESTHPRWSFAKLDDSGFVVKVAEKQPISHHATVGIYYWKHGEDYVRYARQMIAANRTTNNEFYVCPVYNEALADGRRIKIFPVETMWGLGTPEDLEHFLRHGAHLLRPNAPGR